MAARHREQADVIDDEDGRGGVGAQLVDPGAVDLGGDEVGGHLLGGGEVATPAGLDGADGERDSEMRLAASWLTEEENWPVLVDEPQGGEVLDELAVDRGLELEVEVLDGLAEREPGVAQPRREPPVAGVDRFLVEQPGEELDVGPLLCLASSARVANTSAARSSFR